MSKQGSKKEYDPWVRSSFSPATKAEQNQKIVDELIRLCNDIQCPPLIREFLPAIIKTATGKKDIKDL